MNVWIESPFDNLPHEGYRAQRYWLLAEALAEAGHAVVYWTGDFSHASKQKRRLTHPVGENTARLRLIPTLPYFKNVSFRRIQSHCRYARDWKRLAQEAVSSGELARPDAIIASMPTISAAKGAIELGRVFGAKVVVDVMDVWPDTFYRLLPPFLRAFGAFVFASLHRKANYVYRNADLMTGVCDSYGRMVLKRGAKNYHRAYHGIELPPQTPPARTFSPKVIRLAYVGNLGRSYDLSTVLKALVSECDVTLDVAGTGPMEERWKSMAESLGVASRVRFHGYIGSKALCGLLANVDLGVVPMSADSFVALPYKFCDYAKAGLGVISSLKGECEKLICEHRLGVMYDPGDVSSFVEALRRWRKSVQDGVRADLAGLLAKLDAKSIYREYAKTLQVMLWHSYR